MMPTGFDTEYYIWRNEDDRFYIYKNYKRIMRIPKCVGKCILKILLRKRLKQIGKKK